MYIQCQTCKEIFWVADDEDVKQCMECGIRARKENFRVVPDSLAETLLEYEMGIKLPQVKEV